MKWITLSVFAFFSSISSAQSCSSGFTATTPLLNTALHNLYGLAYVHSAVDQITSKYPNAEFCISGIVLSQDIYQYPRFYIQADIRSAGVVVENLRFLYQDASTQALQNSTGQPWTGLNASSANAIVTQATNGVQFANATVNTTDVLTLAQSTATYASATVQSGTVSSIPLEDQNGLHNLQLVTWLTAVDGNIFASTPLTKAVVIGFNQAGQAQVSENFWTFNTILQPLDNLLTAGTPTGSADLAALLLNFSQLSELLVFY